MNKYSQGNIFTLFFAFKTIKQFSASWEPGFLITKRELTFYKVGYRHGKIHPPSVEHRPKKIKSRVTNDTRIFNGATFEYNIFYIILSKHLGISLWSGDGKKMKTEMVLLHLVNHSNRFAEVWHGNHEAYGACMLFPDICAMLLSHRRNPPVLEGCFGLQV
jgi:hypothetical protein